MIEILRTGEEERGGERRGEMFAKQVTAVASSRELSAPRNSLTGPAGGMSPLWERSRQAHAHIQREARRARKTPTQAERVGTRNSPKRLPRCSAQEGKGSAVREETHHLETCETPSQ